MKAALEKAWNVLGNYGRGRSVDAERTEGCSIDGQELCRLETQSRTNSGSSLSPDDLYSEVAKNTIEGDEVLFSKNNIFLKQPLVTLGSKQCDSESIRQESNLTQNKSLDNHLLIPGFLFVTTRGSNFGTTLILNWAPNSSMKVPRVDDSSECSTATPFVGLCSSVSIDLCSMEMIRIFYHMDDKGFIISGELVVKSKEEEFKVNELWCFVYGQELVYIRCF